MKMSQNCGMIQTIVVVVLRCLFVDLLLVHNNAALHNGQDRRRTIGHKAAFRRPRCSDAVIQQCISQASPHMIGQKLSFVIAIRACRANSSGIADVIRKTW